jgi:RHS repeat-associated protein
MKLDDGMRRFLVKAKINAEGNPTRWTFDGLGRMIKVERALALGATINDFTQAQVNQWGFDKNDRLTSHKDDGPNESTWAYDALDRATTMTYPDAKTVAYQFDKNDNVTQTTDPAGNVVADTFDVLDRDTSRAVTLVSSFLGTTSETRTFDGLGRMVTNEDNDYKLEFEYAVIGLESFVYKETQSYVGQTAYAKSVTSTYDAAGNRVSEAYPSGASLSLTYAYNDISRLSSVSDGTNTIASCAWIGVRKKTTTFQSGARRTNYYAGFREEIESVRHETSALATIVRLDYGFNKVHDRAYERFGASGSSGDAFVYDKIRRLTTAWMGSTTPTAPAGNPYVKKIDHNYDDDGNRTSVVTTVYQQAPQTTSYTTNNLNEYTAVGGTTQVSDANGNLTDNGTYLFVYDYKNHIVQVKLKSTSAVIASYRYDALGRRVEKNVGGTVERHILSLSRFADSGRLISNAYISSPTDAERVQDLSHVIAVYDGSDAWKQNFVWNDDVDGSQMLEQKDVLDYDTDGNTTEVTRSFYHQNALGSVMEITDMNQVVVVTYRYDPYGKVTITRGGTPQSSDPLGQHWTFTSRFFDEESGLLYYRARCYDPAIGRFAQRDPLGVTAGPNLFAYVDSGPTHRTDPTGLQGAHRSTASEIEKDVEGYLEKASEDPPWKNRPEGAGNQRDLEKILGDLAAITAKNAWAGISGLHGGDGGGAEGGRFYVDPKLSTSGVGLGVGWRYHADDATFGGAHLSNLNVGFSVVGIYPWQWTPEELSVTFGEEPKVAVQFTVSFDF